MKIVSITWMGRHFLHRGDTNEAKWSDTKKNCLNIILQKFLSSLHKWVLKYQNCKRVTAQSLLGICTQFVSVRNFCNWDWYNRTLVLHGLRTVLTFFQASSLGVNTRPPQISTLFFVQICKEPFERKEKILASLLLKHNPFRFPIFG